MYLGNNFWLVNNGKAIFHSKKKWLIPIEDVPATMRFEKSIGNHQYCRTKSEFPYTDGTKFVVIDYCEEYFYSSSGKTQYVKFDQFNYINEGWVEINGKMKKQENDFKLNSVYIMLFQVDPDHPFNLKLIKKKKIEKEWQSK